MKKLEVYRVDSIKLTPIETKPPQVNISAYGSARTPDWASAEFIPFYYIQAPPDGIYDFTLVAFPPPAGGITTQQITPLPEPASLTEFTAPGFRGVRIHAETNTMEALLAPDPALGQPQPNNEISQLIQHLTALTTTIQAMNITSPKETTISGLIRNAMEECKTPGGQVGELKRRLEAVTSAIAEANQASPSDGQTCRKNCEDTFEREVAKCRDTSCVTRVFGQYVVCLNRCPK